MSTVDVSVVVVNWNTRDLLRTCLASVLRRTEALEVEVIVVDNDSKDGSADMVRAEFPGVTLVANHDNVGFARANNQVFGQCRGRYVLLLNPDTEVLGDALGRMVERLDDHEYLGGLGPQIVHPEGKLQTLHAGQQPTVGTVVKHFSGLSRMFPQNERCRGLHLLAGHHDDVPRKVEWISGACFMVRRSVITELGGFAESWFMYAEDMEWCDRIREAGWILEHYPAAVVTHHVGAASRLRQHTSVMWVRSLRSWYRQRSGAGPVQRFCFDVALASGLYLRSMRFSLLGVARPGSRDGLFKQARDFKLYARAASKSLV